MMDFEIERLFPRFLLNDRNGYAMAKALEAGLKDFLEIAQGALDTLSDVDKMPEWRLDELAWEYNIPYDYTADVSVKREWVRDVYSLSRLYGTPKGIEKYMTAYFDDARLEENWEYDGDPFHFRMNFEGTWTPERVAWATKAIEMVKNVRSVLDNYHFIAVHKQVLRTGCGFYATDKGTYQISCGDAPDLVYYADEDENMLLDEDGMPMLAED